MANSDGSEAMLNRVMTKDNIGVAVVLEVHKELFGTGECHLCNSIKILFNTIVLKRDTIPISLSQNRKRESSNHLLQNCFLLRTVMEMNEKIILIIEVIMYFL